MLFALAVPCALAIPSARAAFFCATTAAEFQAALDSAETNNEDDQISVAGGHYLLTSGLHYSSGQLDSIVIVGGWNDDCSEYINAPTILDGQSATRPLHVASHVGDINIQGLIFQNGLSTNNHGGGLLVTNEIGDIRVEGNFFFNNRADDYAGGMLATSTIGTQRIRNNLFAGNTAAAIGAVELCQTGGEGYFTSNTVIANTSDSDLSVGGLHTECSAHFNLSNNIIWGNNANGAADYGTTIGNSRYNNDIGTLAEGTFGDPVENELSVDPQFCQTLGCDLFELTRNSPLVDVGLDAPPGGLAPVDLARHDRIIGPHVDIGAYENFRIFIGVFEVPSE
ncbi:MAG TPA: hypothetical protein VFG55_08125 [Rhodanobacteraceae bacterium]|nr:hypothetical protein [Rhodanobacteraceae bacterium]